MLPLSGRTCLTVWKRNGFTAFINYKEGRGTNGAPPTGMNS